MADKKKNAPGDGPITIKKYANRRLYNTASSSYVTLEHLALMVREGQDFVVYDAKTGDDITRSVLTQIIFDAEAKGENMLPINFLRQLISFYGDSLQGLLPGYLDMSMEAFARNQQQIRHNLEEAVGQPLKHFDELARRNMQMFQQAMTLFNPFAAEPAGGADPPPSDAPPQPAADPGDEIEALKSQLGAMQQQLDALLKKGS